MDTVNENPHDVPDEINASADSKEFVLLLISMYKDCPELWDSKKKIYMDRNKKNIALNKITNALKRFDKDFTVEKLKRKINTLRSNFNREHSRMKNSLKSGMASDEVYQPKLWYYQEMLFITDSIEIAPTEGSMERSVEVAENGSTNSPTTSTTRKKQKKSKDDEFLTLATNYFKKPESDTDIIAKGWAMKLNRLSPLQRRFAEKIINDVLFEAEMETLTRDGVIFISPTPHTHSMSPAYSNIPSVESGSPQSLPRFSPCTLPSLSSTIISTSDPASKQPVIMESSSKSSGSYSSVPSLVNNPRPRDSHTSVISTPINPPTQNVSCTTIPSRNNTVLGGSLTPVPSPTDNITSPNQYVVYQSPPSQNQPYNMTQYVIKEPCLNTSLQFPINNPGPSSSNTSIVSTPFNQPTQKESFETETECTGAETNLRLATYLQNFNSF